MKIVSLIPARGGSKGIPKKNIMKIGSYPLVAYSIAAAKSSRYIKDVIVTTDSAEIANIAIRYGASIPFLRPKEIAQDNSLDIDFFRHYLKYLQNNNLEIPELIVHLSPTAPFREISIIDDAIEYMMSNEEATSLRSMYKISLTPYKMFKKCGEYAIPFVHYKDIEESYDLPRQTFEETYFPNGHVDIIRTSIILNTQTLHGKNIKIWETEKIVDIDTIEDLANISWYLEDEKFLDIKKYLKEIK